ncbi:MAG TPA: C25 family cysteine peptidase, partial [Bacteroidota bacterium]|nr:C25 family cysteine peptidase [Bacteroidota bacterium]
MRTKLCYKSIQILFSFILLTNLHLLANDSSLYNKYLNYQRKEISKSKILESDWLRSDLDYVKITTTKDGIARLAINDILTFEPQWKGKNSSKLNLIYKANDYPFYLKDNDGIISSDDTLYFIGKRAAGDTTWFNNYTKEEPFFLTYDENSTSKRLNAIDQNIEGTNLINSVPIDMHIEEEHYYNAGKQLYDTYTSDNEGWYWDMISPARDWAYGSTFSYNIFLDLNPGDELDLYVIFKTSADTLYNSIGSNLYPEYNLNFYFNNDSIDNRIFSRVHKDSFYIHLTYDNTIKGYNNIKIIANENHPKRNAEINIDYIFLKGKEKPYAYFQFFNSRFENLTDKCLVKVPNFHSNWIVGIDSLNNQIFFPTSEIQNNAYISLKKRDRGLYFFGFRNNICYDTIDNFHLTIIPYSNPDSVIFFHNWYFSTDFKNLVDSAESNSIIIFEINEINYFAQDAFNFITKYGGTLTSKFLDKNAYYLIFQKDKKVIDENLIQSNEFAKIISFNDLNLIKNLYNANLILQNPNSIIFLNDESQIEKPLLYKVNKPYLRNLSNQAEVVVIYNNYFKDQTEDYIHYRSSKTGLTFLPVDIEDIYNEFNYGKKGVQCIKDYLIYAHNNWINHSLNYLVLFGNASWDPRKIMNSSIATDFVPIYGFPPSDFWYSLLDNDLNPDIGVGRISTSTIKDAENYLKKLKIYDVLPDEPWMKNFLFLSGGYNPDEIRRFSLAKYMFFDEPIESPPFCGTTDSVVKIYYQEAISERQGGEIREKINNGALWVNYLGHANAASFDFDGWQAFRLNNYPKFSFFSTLSCNTGAHAEPSVINSRNEDYLFYPDKGFIGSVGSATWGWVDENRWIVQKMVENLADSTSNLVYVCDLVNYGKKSLANEEAPLYSKFHFTLIGDPLLKLHTSRIPNLYVYPDEFSIVNKNNSKMIHSSGSIAYINCPIYNNGY